MPRVRSFGGSATITYSLAAAGEITLELFDLRGRLIRKEEQGIRSGGKRSLTLSGAGLPAGLYLYRIHSDGIEVAAGKALLLN